MYCGFPIWQPADPYGRGKGEDSRLKLVADVVPVEGEAERPGGFLHSFQMVRQMNNAFIWVEPHRLDQVEGDVAGPGDRALGQAFAPFGIRRAVGNHGRADAQPPGAGLPRNDKGAARSEEPAFAAGTDPEIGRAHV